MIVLVIFSDVRDQCSAVCLMENLHDCDRVLQWVLKEGDLNYIKDVSGPNIVVCYHRVGQLCVVLHDEIWRGWRKKLLVGN